MPDGQKEHSLDSLRTCLIDLVPKVIFLAHWEPVPHGGFRVWTLEADKVTVGSKPSFFPALSFDFSKPLQSLQNIT